MEISKRSWHYRYLEWLDFPYSYNLCGYFWCVVWMVALAPLLVPLYLAVTRWTDREVSEPGLFRSWWQAKKQRICPLIDFVD